MLTAITALGGTLLNGLTSYFKGKQEIAKAAQENRARQLRSITDNNHEWEMRQLENSGWKDDILFYFFIGLFVWTGFYPEASATFFMNIDTMPDWYKETWMWIVASVVGVKKLGDYAPTLIKGISSAFKTESK